MSLTELGLAIAAKARAISNTEAARAYGILRGDRRPERLTRNAMALMGNAGITSLLGIVFWVTAARLYAPEVVGQDAGLIAAMMLLSNLSELGFGQGVPRLLPQIATGRRRAVLLVYISTGLLAAALGLSFVLVSPRISSGFDFLGQVPVLATVFVGSVMLWNVFTLEDAVLTGLRWAVVVPVENAVFAVLKIVLLVTFAEARLTHGILFAWLISMVIVLPAVNWLLFARLLKSPPAIPPPTRQLLPIGDRARVARFLAFDYVATLVGQASTRLLPVLVLAALGNAASAYFYVGFTIATTVGALALALSTSLVVEGAHDEHSLSWLARRALLRCGTLLVPACFLLAVAAPILLLPFGTAYLNHGTGPLRLLLIGCIPLALITIYFGIERVRGRAGRILATQALASAAAVIGAVLLIPHAGLEGVGFAWLIAWSTTAVVILPAVFGSARDPGGPEHDHAPAAGCSADRSRRISDEDVGQDVSRGP